MPFLTSRLLPPWPRPAIMLAYFVHNICLVSCQSAGVQCLITLILMTMRPAQTPPRTVQTVIYNVECPATTQPKEVDLEQRMRGLLPYGDHRNKMHSQRDRHFLVFETIFPLSLSSWRRGNKKTRLKLKSEMFQWFNILTFDTLPSQSVEALEFLERFWSNCFNCIWNKVQSREGFVP